MRPNPSELRSDEPDERKPKKWCAYWSEYDVQMGLQSETRAVIQVRTLSVGCHAFQINYTLLVGEFIEQETLVTPMSLKSSVPWYVGRDFNRVLQILEHLLILNNLIACFVRWQLLHIAEVA